MVQDMIKGVGVALITPFKNYDVDYEALGRMVEYVIEGGVDYIVALGSTAETATMSLEERDKVLRFIVKQTAGRVPIVAGMGSNDTHSLVEQLHTFDLSETVAILSVVPYYNKPTQEGQYQYFKAVAESTDKPIVLYNVPGRTGVNMTAETTLRLAQIDNIVAIKEASGNKEQIMEILRNAPEGFQVLSGNDDDTLWMMENGGAGIISVASNVAPKQLADFVDAIRGGYREKAYKMDSDLTPLFKNCFVESNPIPAKAAMHAMGLIENELRLPLVPSQQSTYDLMVETIRDLGLI